MTARCTPTALVRTSSPRLTGDEDGAALHAGSPGPDVIAAVSRCCEDGAVLHGDSPDIVVGGTV
jgi:hypothetical protein